jgi:hypothetical protein
MTAFDVDIGRIIIDPRKANHIRFGLTALFGYRRRLIVYRFDYSLHGQVSRLEEQLLFYFLLCLTIDGSMALGSNGKRNSRIVLVVLLL